MLCFMLYSILTGITSNYKLYVITDIIIIITLSWMAWSEQYQTNTENPEISGFICMQ